MAASHSGWGAKFVDYDNGGWKDLFVAQSHGMDNIELTQPSTHYRETLLGESSSIKFRAFYNQFLNDIDMYSDDTYKLMKTTGAAHSMYDEHNDGAPRSSQRESYRET